MLVTIYALVDPISHGRVWVSSTHSSLDVTLRRLVALSQHAERGGPFELVMSLEPTIEALDEVPDDVMPHAIEMWRRRCGAFNGRTPTAARRSLSLRRFWAAHPDTPRPGHKNAGKPKSSEARSKLRASLVGRRKDPYERLLMSRAARAASPHRPHTDEERAKIAESQRASWARRKAALIVHDPS